MDVQIQAIIRKVALPKIPPLLFLSLIIYTACFSRYLRAKKYQKSPIFLKNNFRKLAELVLFSEKAKTLWIEMIMKVQYFIFLSHKGQLMFDKKRV